MQRPKSTCGARLSSMAGCSWCGGKRRLLALPGGWADVNESPAAAVEREVFEESGFEARAIKLAAVYDFRKHNRPHHLDSIYKLFFICELTGGTLPERRDHRSVLFCARRSAAAIHRTHDRGAD